MTNEKMLEVINQVMKRDIEPQELIKIKKQLELDVLKDAGKTAGNVKLQSAALKMLKKCTNEQLNGAWISNGKQYFTTGFSAIELNSPIQLPECKEPFKKVESMFAGESDLLELPELEDLICSIKLQKAEGKKNRLYDFGEGKPLVDAELLLDVMSILPGAECTYNKGKLLNNIQFWSTRGRAILCVIKRV